MDKFSWELLIHCCVTDVTQQCQVPARMKTNGNFSDTSHKWLHLVSVNIITWWTRVTLLTRSHAWCMRWCFSGIRRATLWCNGLPLWTSMCTMLLSNARPSQMLKGLGMLTKTVPLVAPLPITTDFTNCVFQNSKFKALKAVSAGTLMWNSTTIFIRA